MIKPPAIQKRTSSGGVIFRFSSKVIQVALVLVKKKKTWCLPKGSVDKGETFSVAALREVREETGLTGEIIDKLGMISYWYFIKDDMIRIHKTVHFYLVKFISGSTDDHDHEVDEAKWFPIDEALKTLSYKSERDIVQKAKAMLEKT